jgi:hypothetical protein
MFTWWSLIQAVSVVYAGYRIVRGLIVALVDAREFSTYDASVIRDVEKSISGALRVAAGTDPEVPKELADAFNKRHGKGQR